MLSTIHENASTWYLYIRDRGAIDWLLNKPILSILSANRFQVAYFQAAHMLQLLETIYMAARKGIDGISLVVILAVSTCF